MTQRICQGFSPMSKCRFHDMRKIGLKFRIETTRESGQSETMADVTLGRGTKQPGDTLKCRCTAARCWHATDK